ncbi:ArsR/SmtB family transcription factor [Paractinoplanes lichenicola]|uniref:Helix-turn-helix domain-containing protein n=1 Tax=Paractinoplanes lichenicola TaxID=2802976 RepID=A0ABS1VEJ4_9ACTN|nr:helix-turn-helix domain-containing protein [Actinoplanes lichenicola]MBL7253106.1 helix-turn-helix domain-containing protein [Actinoplanes lichenicola]
MNLDPLAVTRALSNEVRLHVLQWLKDPARNFPPPDDDAAEGVGVCVSDIQRKAGLAASTMSAHLSVLHRAGLVRATRAGQWTYYQRDEDAIKAFAGWVMTEL